MRVGLTGGIASGKSAVATRLAELGAVVVDADVLAREVVAAGTDGFAEVVATFGDGVVGADGELDRSALGRLVFADETARRRLEAVVHPRVRTAAAAHEAAARERDPGAVVVHVVPLLVETGQTARYERLVVVDVEPATQLRRLVELRGHSPEEAALRVAAQAGRAERLAAATDVITNDGGLDDLMSQVDRLWATLRG